MKYRLPEIEIARDAIFKNDKLKRSEVVKFLANHLARVSGPYVLALDAPYGSGKTTLVKMLQATLEQDSFYCIYVNLWEHDFSGDPLVPIIVALQAAGTNVSSRKHLAKAKKWAGAIIKHGAVAAVRAATFGALEIDKDLEKVTADATGALAADAIEAFQKERESIESFKSEVEKAISAEAKDGKPRPVVIILDELDRCRPSFAVETLERIKHLFNIDSLIFVLSLDKSQLESGVAAIYGERINSAEYLRKFFDIEYGVPMNADEPYTESLLDRSELNDVFSARKGPTASYDRSNFVKFFTVLSDLFGLSLRARERCITRLCVVLDQTPPTHFLDPTLVALLLVLRSNSWQLFDRLVQGTAGSREVVDELEAMPRFVASRHARALASIEGYLLAGDRNSQRSNDRLLALKGKSNDPDISDERRADYRHAVALYSEITNGMRGEVNIAAIVRKVDIAAYISD